MALTFPSSPTNGQLYVDIVTGNRYIYDSSKNLWKYAANNVGMTVGTAPPPATSANPGAMWYNTNTGRTFILYDDGDSKQWVENVPAVGSFDSSTVAGYANAAVLPAVTPAYNTANSGYVVANAAFAKANTALQNTSGTFAGSLSVTANVGIGVSSPAYRIHVVRSDPSSLGPIARLYHGPNSDRSMEFGTTTAANYLSYIQAREAGNNPYDLALNPENGNVGIGTTQPLFKLQVGTGSAAANNYAWFNGNVGTGSAPNALFGLLIGTNYSGGASEANIIWGQGIGSGQHFAIGKTTGSAYTEQFRIDSSGRITKPLQPAFYATGAATNITLGNQGDLALGTAVYNIGSHYNTSNYRFTAPVAGRYLFTWSVFVNAATGRCSLKLNGASYNNLQMDAGGGFSQSAILNLAVNDYVTVGDWQNLSGLQYYGSHSHFSGHLLS